MAKETTSNIIKTAAIIIGLVASTATTIVTTSYLSGKTAGTVEQKIACLDDITNTIKAHDTQINDTLFVRSAQKL